MVDRSRTACVWAALAAGALLVGLGLGVGSCSFLLDLDATQCRSDGDCSRFGATTCDKARKICVARAVSAADGAAESAGDAGAGPDQGDARGDANADAPLCRSLEGCLPCPPGAATGLLNACTGVLCVPFDNAARLHNLTADGALKPLP